MDVLAAAYENAGKPVLFLEQSVSDPLGNRIDRWWDAFGPAGRPEVPLMMVDSGRRVSYGAVDFTTMYMSMVDVELARAPGAAIRASWHRVGSVVFVTAEVTNQSSVTLGRYNLATVDALVFERAHVSQTGRYVRAATARKIYDDLAPGATLVQNLALENVSVGQWDQVSVVVLVEYQPIASETRWDMLQAALAVEVEMRSVFLPGLFTQR